MIENDGSNNYKIPHMGKEKLVQVGQLLTSLSIDLDLIQRVQALVNDK
jgi:hypothetical protein